MTHRNTARLALAFCLAIPGLVSAQTVWTVTGGIATTNSRIDICDTTVGKCSLRTNTNANQFEINNRTTGPTRFYYGLALELKADALGSPGIFMSSDGKVAIGKSNPQFQLDVLGTIRADEVRVDQSGADFVFADTYELMPLPEVERAIRENRHLPGVPSAAEMQKSGVDVGEMQNLLLQKVEELTLYVIELQKENRALVERIDALGTR